MSKLTKQSELEEVVLQKRHTHQGQVHEIGSTIKVNAIQKTWLAEHNIIAAETVTLKRGES